MSIDVEIIYRADSAGRGLKAAEGFSGSPTDGSMASRRQSADATPDQEYVRRMEENYGIREEGFF